MWFCNGSSLVGPGLDHACGASQDGDAWFPPAQDAVNEGNRIVRETNLAYCGPAVRAGVVDGGSHIAVLAFLFGIEQGNPNTGLSGNAAGLFPGRRVAANPSIR